LFSFQPADDDTDTDGGGGDNFLQSNTMNTDNLENQDLSKISEEFAGAPEKVFLFFYIFS